MFRHLCLWLQLWNWCGRLWLRLIWCGFEACRWPSFPPLSDTRWEDGENSTARLFNILEQVLTCVWNIFLAVDAHCQEAIHPRWIFVLAGRLFLKHLCEEWLVLWQCLHGWRSKQWSFKWPTRSQCRHRIAIVEQLTLCVWRIRNRTRVCKSRRTELWNKCKRF